VACLPTVAQARTSALKTCRIERVTASAYWSVAASGDGVESWVAVLIAAGWATRCGRWGRPERVPVRADPGEVGRAPAGSSVRPPRPPTTRPILMPDTTPTTTPNARPPAPKYKRYLIGPLRPRMAWIGVTIQPVAARALLTAAPPRTPVLAGR
jgi:hypothetical protein